MSAMTNDKTEIRIQPWNSNGKILHLPHENATVICVTQVFKDYGFTRVTDYLLDFVSQDSIILKSYQNDEGMTIVQLLNTNEELFCFKCTNVNDLLDCIKSLMALACDMLKCQELLKKLGD